MDQTLQPHFAALNLNIEQLEMTPHGGWRVRLDTEAVIELGSGTTDQVLARTDRFLKTLTQVVARYGRTPEALETADLRHEDGYAIRLRGVSTLVADAKKK
jgi:cell division protein FtsQ